MESTDPNPLGALLADIVDLTIQSQRAGRFQSKYKRACCCWKKGKHWCEIEIAMKANAWHEKSEDEGYKIIVFNLIFDSDHSQHVGGRRRRSSPPQRRLSMSFFQWALGTWRGRRILHWPWSQTFQCYYQLPSVTFPSFFCFVDFCFLELVRLTWKGGRGPTLKRFRRILTIIKSNFLNQLCHPWLVKQILWSKSLHLWPSRDEIK